MNDTFYSDVAVEATARFQEEVAKELGVSPILLFAAVITAGWDVDEICRQIGKTRSEHDAALQRIKARGLPPLVEMHALALAATAGRPQELARKLARRLKLPLKAVQRAARSPWGFDAALGLPAGTGNATLHDMIRSARPYFER